MGIHHGDRCVFMRSAGFLAVIGVLFAGLLGLSFAGSKPRQAGAKAEEALKGYQITRCLFAEKRLVVKHKDELHVLHEGEFLPESNIRIIHFDRTQAVLEKVSNVKSGSGSRTPQELFLIKEEAGKTVIKVLSSTSDTPPFFESSATVSIAPENVKGGKEDGHDKHQR